MEADLQIIEGDERASADEQFAAMIEQRAQIAFAGGCRLAAKHARCEKGCHIGYDFVVLSPGESAPAADWTIYEERDGRAVGRSAA